MHPQSVESAKSYKEKRLTMYLVFVLNLTIGRCGWYSMNENDDDAMTCRDAGALLCSALAYVVAKMRTMVVCAG